MRWALDFGIQGGVSKFSLTASCGYTAHDEAERSLTGRIGSGRRFTGGSDMRIGIVAAALALGACARQPLAPGVAEAPASVTTAQATPGAAVASGEARIPVTAVVAERGVNRATAADCVGEGTGFRAEFAAPTVLAVPTFGRGTGGVRIVCEAGGLGGAVRAEPSVARAGGGYGGFPVVGIGVGTGSGGGTSVSVGGFFGGGGGWVGGAQPYVIRYPAVEVRLSRGGGVE